MKYGMKGEEVDQLERLKSDGLLDVDAYREVVTKR
jgi:hypothetical protein